MSLHLNKADLGGCCTLILQEVLKNECLQSQDQKNRDHNRIEGSCLRFFETLKGPTGG
jgi:hypothetical protein